MYGKLRSLAFTSLGHFSNDGTTLLYPTLITYYVELPGIKIPYLGAMAIIFNIISGIFSTPVGNYADRKGNHGSLIAAGILILALSSFLLALPFVIKGYTLALILSGATVLGIGQAFYHPLGAAVLRSTFEARSAPSAMGVNGSFGSLGRAIMPLVIVFLMTALGYFHGLLIYTLYSIVSAAVIYVGLRGLEVRQSRKSSGSDSGDRTEKKRNMKAFMPFLYMLTAAVFVRSLFLTGTITFIPTLFDETFKSKTLMVTIITLAYIFPVLGQPYFGRVTATHGGRFTVIVTFVLSTIFFGLFLIFYHNFILTIIFYGGYAFAAYSGFPVFLGYVGQVVPKEFSGASNGLVWGIGQTVGGGIGAAVITLFTLFVNVPTAILYMFPFAVGSLLFLPFLPTRGKAEKLASSA